MGSENYIFWIWRDLSIIKHLLAAASVVFSILGLVFLNVHKAVLNRVVFKILNTLIWIVLTFCVFFFACSLFLSVKSMF